MISRLVVIFINFVTLHDLHGLEPDHSIHSVMHHQHMHADHYIQCCGGSSLVHNAPKLPFSSYIAQSWLVSRNPWNPPKHATEVSWMILKSEVNHCTFTNPHIMLSHHEASSSFSLPAGKHCIAFDNAHQNVIRKCCLSQATGLEDCEEQPTQTPGMVSSTIQWILLRSMENSNFHPIYI